MTGSRLAWQQAALYLLPILIAAGSICVAGAVALALVAQR